MHIRAGGLFLGPFPDGLGGVSVGRNQRNY